MTEIDRIIDELQRAYEGEPWHGWPLTTILAGVTASQAVAHPVAAAHSIWELVLHMTAWKSEVRRRLGGAAAGDPAEGDWRTVSETSEEHWRNAIAQLDRAHRDLLAAIREMPADKLFEPTNDPRNRPTGAGVSHYVLLHGSVQHDVYHSGQIAILKKAPVSGSLS